MLVSSGSVRLNPVFRVKENVCHTTTCKRYVSAANLALHPPVVDEPRCWEKAHTTESVALVETYAPQRELSRYTISEKCRKLRPVRLVLCRFTKFLDMIIIVCDLSPPPANGSEHGLVWDMPCELVAAQPGQIHITPTTMSAHRWLRTYVARFMIKLHQEA